VRVIRVRRSCGVIKDWEESRSEMLSMLPATLVKA